MSVIRFSFSDLVPITRYSESSILQSISSVLICTFRHDKILRNKEVQVIPCARRFRPMCSAISDAFASKCSVKKARIVSFILVLIGNFLSPIFSNVSVNKVLSCSSCSVITGIIQPCSRQMRKIFGIPLPVRSPISMRLNIFRIVPLRGSEIPPLLPASISIRKLSGVDVVMKFRFFMMTRPWLS